MTVASKIIITIISLVTVVAIFAGVFMHVVKGYSFGRSTKTVENTVNLDGTLSEIIMDIDFSEINIKTGNEFSVHYSVPEAIEPKVELKNGTLEVRTPSTNNLHLDFGNVKSDNFITITIPEDSELARISIDVDAGEVNLEDLDVSKLQMSVDAGNIQLQPLRLVADDALHQGVYAAQAHIVDVDFQNFHHATLLRALFGKPYRRMEGKARPRAAQYDANALPPEPLAVQAIAGDDSLQGPARRHQCADGRSPIHVTDLFGMRGNRNTAQASFCLSELWSPSTQRLECKSEFARIGLPADSPRAAVKPPDVETRKRSR